MIELDGVNLCPYCFRTIKDEYICSCIYSGKGTVENALPIGTILNGRYIVGALIGDTTNDGFTKKYLCYDYHEKKKVYINEFYPLEYVGGRTDSAINVYTSGNNLEVYNNLMQKYIAKVKTAQAINCQYSLKVLSAFYENNTAYFVVEAHSLLSVKEYAENNNRISCEKAVKYLYQFLTFLSCADREGIVHCGLKDTSVYIDEEKDEIFIDGFECTHYNSNPFSTRYYSLNSYMHVKSGASPDSKVCDYFSAGAILYTLLTRKVPTSDIVCEDRFDLFAFEKIADEELRSLLKKMCSISAQEYSSFNELIDDANSLFVKYGFEPIDKFNGSISDNVSSGKKRRTVIVMVITVVLVATVALCGFLYIKGRDVDATEDEITTAMSAEDDKTEDVTAVEDETAEDESEETGDISETTKVSKSEKKKKK